MNQTIGVNITPQSFQPTLHYSQGDVGRVFVVNVTDYDIPTGATVTCVATKPSGMGFTVSGTVSGNSVTFTSTAEMTDEWGRFPAEIRIASGSTLLGTANFLMIGEKDPHPASTIDGTQEELIPQLTLLVNRVEAAAESVHDLTVSATTLTAGSDATATYDSTNNSIAFGIPRGADGDVTRSEFNDLKSDFNDCFDSEEITPINLLDYSKVTFGKYKTNTGVIADNASYYYTDLIPVEVGKTYTKQAGNLTVVQGRQIKVMGRWLSCYDAARNIMASAGRSDSPTSFTVPEGVAFICFSGSEDMKPINHPTVVEGTTVLDYSEYFEPYNEYTVKENVKISADAIPDLSGRVNVNLDNLTFAIRDNLFDVDAEDNADGYYLNNGTLGQNSTYFTTGYIPVEPNSSYAFYPDANNPTARLINEFDENKVFVEGSQQSYVSRITTGASTKYIRVTFYHNSYGQSTIVRGSVPDPNATRTLYIPSSYIGSGDANLHVYLPKDIYVAVGRTIELYNELVCLEASKYHIDWNCSVGVDYARKFSVTGTANNIGNYTLTLQITDDNLKTVYTGSATVHIVSNSLASVKKVLAIGDSLTNAKAWETEVPTLSNDKIDFIGTRGTSAIQHEGRSGATAAWYNGDNTYSFDNNYIGSPEVAGNKNPFWDGSKFSLNHYITTQSAYVGTPDAVQIFLGTNGIALDPTVNVTNIKAMVDSIVSEYPNMPIFVCNTIYRSNQDGYYSTGSDGYVAIAEYQYSADMKVMNLQNALAEAFADYSTVTIVPLSVCMDRENDFGQVEVPVNPRLTSKTVFIPNESVHPQLAGYQQIADVMFSAYCAKLG